MISERFTVCYLHFISTPCFNYILLHTCCLQLEVLKVRFVTSFNHKLFHHHSVSLSVNSGCSGMKCYFIPILCLIPRTSVTSLIMSMNTRCKTHPLCVNLCSKFLFERMRKHTCAMTIVFLRNTRWRHGRSRGVTKYRWKGCIINYWSITHPAIYCMFDVSFRNIERNSQKCMVRG